MSLLNDGRLARTVANALKGIFYDITIRRTTPGGYDPGVGVTPGTTTDYVGKGMVDSFSTQELVGGLVQPGDKRVTLLTTGLGITVTPSTDTIVIGGNVLTIISTQTDPAGATITLQVR